MGSTWRWRRCPNCFEVIEAGDLINHHRGPAWNDGSAATECPDCGFEGARREFFVVREDHVDRPPSGADHFDTFEVMSAAWAIVKDGRDMTKKGHGAAVQWARAYLGLDDQPRVAAGSPNS